MKSFRLRTASVWMLAGALFFVVQSASSHSNPSNSSAQANPADTSPDGIPNFARVTDTLYRGGQPSLIGFGALQHLGVGIIVNFRDEPGENASEKRYVESLGIKYIAIPWSGHQKPSDTQIVEFLDLVRTNPQTKIFVHCQRGADRTGTMIAAYRIAVQHETADQAVSEMHQFHYNHFWLPQLERYVNSLPRLLEDNSLFSAYGPGAKSAGAATAVAAVAAPIVH